MLTLISLIVYILAFSNLLKRLLGNVGKLLMALSCNYHSWPQKARGREVTFWGLREKHDVEIRLFSVTCKREYEWNIILPTNVNIIIGVIFDPEYCQ